MKWLVALEKANAKNQQKKQNNYFVVLKPKTSKLVFTGFFVGYCGIFFQTVCFVVQIECLYLCIFVFYMKTFNENLL